ncbi:MAG: penicillin-binding transpeptidase domain-containing protein [Nitrospirota bacterium]
MQITSTLDADIQRFSAETLNYQINTLKNQNVNDGAVLIVENRTGNILAYVGGTEASPHYVDGVQARRQAGSTLKPFLYASAFEKRLITPASVLSDSPVDIPTEYGIYKPGNYDNDFKGLVSVRTALASSLNIPAVRTLKLVGENNFVRRLEALGFNLNQTDGYYGPSLALGTADVSLYELVNAFRALANKGVWSEMRLTPDISINSRKRIYSEESVFLISDILSDRAARSVTFSLENPLSTRFWSVVKTGTSKDMRDNWCVGFSQDYTVGAWVGNFTGEPMWDVSGVSGAAPVWLEIMNYLHKDSSVRQKKVPGGVRKTHVSFANMIEPDRDEWFIVGTEPSGVSEEKTVLLASARNTDRPHILYPPDGAVFAIDPDIPEDQQRIFFESEGSINNMSWMLDSELLGSNTSSVSWKPGAGRHTLSIMNSNNNMIESVSFLVKGAGEDLSSGNLEGRQ